MQVNNHLPLGKYRSDHKKRVESVWPTREKKDGLKEALHHDIPDPCP